MTIKIECGGLQCLCAESSRKDRIIYILYPMDIPDGWIGQAAERYDASIVVITGMEWQDVMSPWPAAGVPKGSPDFKGEAPEFLSLLQRSVLPRVESALGIGDAPRRMLVGVSMSGLFALWQWMLCDTFTDIASLSGSFWYAGFLDWMKSVSIPKRSGRAFFLLGDREAKSKVREFDTVAVNTGEIVALLSGSGIATEFRSVPGNHYSDPVPRLDTALTALCLRQFRKQ